MTADLQKLIRAPVSPRDIRPEFAPSGKSSYKNRNWYYRHVLGILPPVEYHDGVEAAIDAARLP
jgi:hypothetical protein